MLRQPSGFWGLFATDMIVRAAYQMAKSPVLPILAASLGANKLMIGTIVGVSTLTGSVLKPLIGALSIASAARWSLAAGLFADFPSSIARHTPMIWGCACCTARDGDLRAVTLAIAPRVDANRGARIAVEMRAEAAPDRARVAGGILAIARPRTVFTSSAW